VKVESAGRVCLTRLDVQVSRSTRESFDDKPWFAHLNTSKKGVRLDLKKPQSRDVLNRLIDWADIVVENFSPGTMKKLGLDYESLKARKPDIIMVSGSVFGQTGPLSQEWGIDGTGAALSSRLFLTGWPDREPALPGAPYGDALLPFFLASGALAALDHRRRTGEGTHIDASMLEVQVQQMLPAILDQQITGVRPARCGNRAPDAAPQGVYPCLGSHAEPERWIAISCSDDTQWQALCSLIGQPSLAQVDRYATFANRKANEDELDQIIGAWTKTQEDYPLMQRLQIAGVAAGVVQTVQDVVERDAQLQVRGAFPEVEHPVLGTFGHQAPPYKLSKTPAHVRHAPKLGQHTREVLTETLGYSNEEFATLDEAGIFF
jgi:benzylsuccinate CoA-transferase BbsF subunit